MIAIACLIVALLIVGLTIYKRWRPPVHLTPQTGPTSSSSIPPFATKEPERYQATRINSFSESTVEGNNFNETRKTVVRLVRDGTQRREEYETVAAGWIAYLETLRGRFVLLPADKLYADLSEASDDAKLSELQTDSESIQSNYILHESNVAPRYEKLGSETIDGRQTVKYRVITSSPNNATPANERVIWVDETLGMPVKTELIHREGMRSLRVLVQLTDIRTDVDLAQFEIPGDYRKVKASQIFDLMARRAETTDVEKPQK